MTGRRIIVISPRTWGQFGNYLAATRMAGVIQERLPDDEVAVWEAETSMPWIGEIGARIAKITTSSPDPATRTARYLELMAEIEQAHPCGFEVDDDSPVQSQVAGLRAALTETRPDLVIGTKGFVARLGKAALRQVDLTVPVVAHTTNPGLLELPIHRSALLDAVLVPFDWAKERLLGFIGGDPDRVHVVGPLVGRHDLGTFVAAGASATGERGWPAADGPEARPRLIVFSNRGGEEYLTLLRRLATRHPDTDVVFVGYDDAELVRRAVAGAPPSRWRFHTRLTQREYFAYIDGAAAGDAFLISKAGPNTTLEAAYFGIPVLMLESGLPMEGWVGGLIHDQGLGRCCADVSELLAILDTWLAERHLLRRHKQACRRFANEVLDQAAVARRIENVVRALLDQRAASRLPVG